jgi:hypothetical protein
MLPTMYELMCLQIILCAERFVTHITGIWTLFTMYALMCLQMNALIE